MKKKLWLMVSIVSLTLTTVSVLPAAAATGQMSKVCPCKARVDNSFKASEELKKLDVKDAKGAAVEVKRST